MYKQYNHRSGYVSISNADRSGHLDFLATVYNGIKVSDFTYNETPGDYLLYFGRIHPDKGTSEAIEIAVKSKKRLLIAGIIQDKGYFDEKINPLLNDEIIFIGDTGPEKRNRLLGHAVALLHPINFDEPFGLSVAEAMLCGTPVIAFNRGSMPELIVDGKTGFLVDTVDEAVDVLADIRKINRLDCRQWSFDNFSQEKMVNEYIKLYNLVLAKV